MPARGTGYDTAYVTGFVQAPYGRTMPIRYHMVQTVCWNAQIRVNPRPFFNWLGLLLVLLVL
jgi:hypothetical protein